LSLKGKITNYLNPVDYSTENEDYSAEELTEEATEILGQDTLKTLNRGGLLTTVEEVPVYDPQEDRGVRVNSWRAEAYDALEEAAETLSKDDEELLEP